MNEPLTPPDCDLQGFQFTPVFRARLFGSSFHARTSDAEWRAGVTLWLKSWDQVPAGSLPDDDIDLCRLAELGRDTKTWKKVRAGAMRGWIKCSDGRLYHPVVAEGVNEAWQGKLRQEWRTECARIKKANQRNGTDEVAPDFETWLSSRHSHPVPKDNTDMSLGTSEDVPEEMPSNREGKGQGHREGIEERESARATRLPLDWTPTAELFSFATGLGLTHDQIDNEIAKFRDYWTAQPGAKGRKLDWPATFRNWIRRCAEDKRPAQQRGNRFGEEAAALARASGY